jgi:hypothetical protein
MVDKKTFTDSGAGMDIDSGPAVGILRHDAWDQRYFLLVNLMRYTIYGYGKEPGIAEYNFIVAFCGRVAFVGGADIFAEQHPQAGQFFHKTDCDLLPPFLTVNTCQIMPPAVMTDCEGNLPGQGLKKGCGFLPDRIVQIHLIYTVIGKVSRIENAACYMNDIDNLFFRGQRFKVHMVETVLGIAGLNKLIHNARDFFTKLPGDFYFYLALLKPGLMHSRLSLPELYGSS